MRVPHADLPWLIDLKREQALDNRWMRAARVGDTDELNRLLQVGMDPGRYVLVDQGMVSTMAEQVTALHLAAFGGHLVACRLLLANGSEVDALTLPLERRESGDTPLMRAVWGRSLAVAELLLGHHPLSWVAHPWLLGLTAVSALLTIAVARFMYRLRMTFLVLDAIGLVVFTILGCDVALTMQVPLLIVIVAGMITGCVGGVLRDVLCNDVPLLFRSELYASVSVVVGIIYVGGVWLHLNHDLVVLVTLAIGLTFRLLAIAFKWEMPKFVYDADLH